MNDELVHYFKYQWWRSSLTPVVGLMFGKVHYSAFLAFVPVALPFFPKDLAFYFGLFVLGVMGYLSHRGIPPNKFMLLLRSLLAGPVVSAKTVSRAKLIKRITQG